MKENGIKLYAFVFIGVLLLCVTGCATSRGVVDVQITPGTNPSGGKAVKVVSVTDGRKFEVAPRTQSIPSLSEEEIKDVNIRSRAIGRKRNTYGKALGDFLLPEGRTVQLVIREAITKALRDKGYAVVDEGSADFDKALPLQADIKQYWAYMTPGFWAITLESEAIVSVQGDIFPALKEVDVRGYGKMSSQTGVESNWIEVMQKSIDDFIANLKEKLRDQTRD